MRFHFLLKTMTLIMVLLVGGCMSYLRTSEYDYRYVPGGSTYSTPAPSRDYDNPQSHRFYYEREQQRSQDPDIGDGASRKYYREYRKEWRE